MALEERIDIEIVDKVPGTIVKKLSDIAAAAQKGHESITLLERSLNAINTTALDKLSASNNKLQISENNLMNSMYKKDAALSRAVESEFKAEIASSKLAIANQKLAAETSKTSIAQHNISAAAARASAAQSRAEIASLRLSTAQEKLAKSSRNVDFNLSNAVRTAAAFAGLGFSGAQIVRAADSYTILENKLRNVSDSEKQLVQVTDEVFNVANKTRTEVGATAQAFARFDRAIEILGGTQRESLKITQTVNELLIMGGAATSEQTAGLLQLSQAFNKGKLDGDEFRTVMELMPGVADAIAKQLNVTRGELLKLAPDGKITADVLRKALLSVADETEAKFKTLVPTIGQALTVLENKFVQFFGQGKGKVLANQLANALLFLSDNMDILTVAIISLSSVMLVSFAPSIARGIVAIGGFFAALAANPIGLLVVGLSTVIGFLAIFKDDIKLSEDGLVTFGDAVKGTLQTVKEYLGGTARFWTDEFGDAFKKTDDASKLTTENMTADVDYFTSAWSTGMTENKKSSSDFYDFFLGIIYGIGNYLKDFINDGIRKWNYMFIVATSLWEDFPGTIKDAFFLMSNYVLTAIEKTINGIVNNINSALSWINDMYKKLGVSENLLQPIQLDFKLDLTDFKNAEVETGNLKKRLDEIANKDYLGDFIDDIKKASRLASETRRNAPKSGDALRDSGKNRAVKDSGKAKKEIDINEYINKILEKRATALVKVNRELDSEIKLQSKQGSELEVMTKFSEIENQLLDKKIALLPYERKEILAKLWAIQRQNEAVEREKQNQSELASIYSETKGVSDELERKIRNVTLAYNEGYISLNNYKQSLVEAQLELSKTRLEMDNAISGDVMTVAINKTVEDFQNMASSIADIFGNLFSGIVDGFADSIGRAIVMGDDLGKSLKNVARNVLSEMISQLVKVGIQFVINQGIQQAAIAAITATSVASAGALAAAWGPAATAASIATMGGAAAEGKAAALVAIKSSGAGFYEGGYTGNIGRREIAGVVHGREFVFDANATARLGAGNLESLRKGASNISDVKGGAVQNSNQMPATSMPTNVKIINVDTPEAVYNYMSSEEGEQIVINHYRKNIEIFKALLS